MFEKAGKELGNNIRVASENLKQGAENLRTGMEEAINPAADKIEKGAEKIKEAGRDIKIGLRYVNSASLNIKKAAIWFASILGGSIILSSIINHK